MPPRLDLSHLANYRETPSNFDAFDSSGDCARMTLLVARVAEGSETALGEIYDLTVDRVFSLAAQVTRDRPSAEELVCAAYLHAWRSAGRFRHFDGSVVEWLLVICADMAGAAGWEQTAVQTAAF
jgi:hypothetical protein